MVDVEPEEFETSKGVKVVNSFDAMKLNDKLLRGIYAYGFEKPSAIQQRAVLPVISGRDVIAQAQSGTGKSSMIAITMCQILDINVRECVSSVQRHLSSPTNRITVCRHSSFPQRASWPPKPRRTSWPLAST